MLVAYFFPPTGGVSVARILRTAECLPRYGWEPIVVAPTSSGHFIQDPAGLAGIPPDLRVIRTPCPEPAKLRRLVKSRIDRRSSRAGNLQASSPSAALAVSRPRRAAAQMSLLAGRFFFPDEQVVWLPFAVAAAVHAAREFGADAILSTSSPATAHLAAMLASRIVGIPWIADFQDPWVGNALEDDVPRAIAAMRRRLERRFIASAAELTFVTPSLTKRYQKRYPGYADRMRTVPNGYDRRERVEPIAHDPEHFTLVYAGPLWRPRELTVFLAGLQAAVTAEPCLSDRLRVRFVGSVTEECGAPLHQAMASSELASIIELVGQLPRGAALGHIQASDAALLLLPDGAGTEIIASGKLYDYIGRDRQVLAVVPQCEAAQVLRELDWGVIVPPTVDGVAGGIREVMAARPKRTVADPEGRFDWVNLTSLFAAALNRAVTSRNARSSGCARQGADGDSRVEMVK